MELLSEMVVFARVVELKGFSAAARQLRLTTSAISRSVARLESHMGTRLLHRTTRSVTLTEIGREVYARCARIAETAREVEALAGSYVSAPRGRLRVSAPTVLGQVWLTPQLPSFLRAWPHVELELMLDNRLVDLVDEAYDVAIRISAGLPEGLIARLLFATSYVLVASPDYLARSGAPRTPADLQRHQTMYLGYGAFDARLVMTRGDVTEELEMRSRVTISNAGAMLDLVEGGLGIGLVPDFAVRASLDDGRVRRVLEDWSIGGAYRTRQVHAVYAPTKYVPQKLRAFIDHLVEASRRGPDLPPGRRARHAAQRR